MAAPTNAAATTPMSTDIAVGKAPEVGNSHGITGSRAPMRKARIDEIAALVGDASLPGSTPSSARACTTRARSGRRMTSWAAFAASSSLSPSARYISASSAVSAGALWAISRRSISSSRSMSSFCAETLIHSPAAMLMPPAMAPASPASRTIDASTPLPAKPRISETLDTSPSLMPKTAARAELPVTERCWWWTSACATARRYRSVAVQRGGQPRSTHRYARAGDETRQRRRDGRSKDVDMDSDSSHGTPAVDDSHAVAEALGRLCDMVALRQPDDPLLVRFLPLYYSELPADDVDDRKLDDVYAVAVAHLALGRVRAPGACVARVLSPDRERDGWHSQHSVLLVVTDDMPFLVDTMRMVLERRGLRIHLLVHPMLRAVRDDHDRLVDVAPDSADAVGPLEAWTQIEIDRTDGATAAAVEADILRAVDDVQRVVDDFDAMRERMEALAAVDPILPWLAAGQYVF